MKMMGHGMMSPDVGRFSWMAKMGIGCFEQAHHNENLKKTDIYTRLFQMTFSNNDRKLAWTGERMVPFESDPVTEYYHWQRYTYFRPWYQDVKVIDAASGEGYGTAYAGSFATEAFGFDISKEAVEHSTATYPNAHFTTADVCDVDYRDADLVVSFETIEHLPDPEKFLKTLAKCQGRILISTPNRLNHSPGNALSDKPLNEFHSIEWTPTEFAKLICQHFQGRQIRFLSQENRFPGLIREGLSDDAKYVIAVIGGGELPKWPKIGLSMPTCNGPQRVRDAIYNFTRFYPGELEVAVVANAANPETTEKLRALKAEMPHLVHLIESEENLGYGRGANRGLEHLQTLGGFDLYGVTNDDVIASIDCLPIMTDALSQLERLGHKPGCIGPVSNSINGRQQVNIGSFTNYPQMMALAHKYRAEHFSDINRAEQVRGLFVLITPSCLKEVGGLDPLFGLGNFEDDDWNLRLKFAGYTLWVASGAFLYHAGSSTFKELQLDYAKNIDRNLKLFLEKWESKTHAEAFQRPLKPSAVSLNVPLNAAAPSSGHSMTFSLEPVDLVWQATPPEFAAGVMLMLQNSPRSARQEVLDLLARRQPARSAA